MLFAAYSLCLLRIVVNDPMFCNQWVYNRARFSMREMLVISLERGAVCEIADEREIDGAFAFLEVAADFDAEEAGDAAELGLEGCLDFGEARAAVGCQAP